MRRGIARLGKFFLLAACVLYPWFAHSAVLAHKTPAVGFFASLIPILGLVFFLWQRGYLSPLWGAVLIAGGAVFAVLGLQEHWNPALSYGIPHAAINFFLFWLFASTLGSDSEPLITRVAHRVHGELTPEIVRYTRGVTLAWSLFFIAQIVISLLLYRLAPFSLWLVFISFMTFPLLALMFLAEYLVRIIFHPNHPRVSVAKAVRAFTQDFGGPRRGVDAP